MRFIYKILIGLIIFNGVLILFADFFPESTESSHATDITGENDITSYGSITESMFSNVMIPAIATGGAIFGISLALAVLSQQYALFIGIGAFVAIFGSLWSLTSGILTKITNYPVVNGLVTIITIIIGIIAVFSVVEMLNAQRGVD